MKITPIFLCTVITAIAVTTRAGDPLVKTNEVPDSTRKVSEIKTTKKKMSGADLYSINCNRCHPDRFPVERQSPHEKTIVLHMRVRANIPAGQARQILDYLEQDSGN